MSNRLCSSEVQFGSGNRANLITKKTPSRSSCVVGDTPVSGRAAGAVRKFKDSAHLFPRRPLYTPLTSARVEGVGRGEEVFSLNARGGCRRERLA